MSSLAHLWQPVLSLCPRAPVCMYHLHLTFDLIIIIIIFFLVIFTVTTLTTASTRPRDLGQLNPLLIGWLHFIYVFLLPRSGQSSPSLTSPPDLACLSCVFRLTCRLRFTLPLPPSHQSAASTERSANRVQRGRGKRRGLRCLDQSRGSEGVKGRSLSAKLIGTRRTQRKGRLGFRGWPCWCVRSLFINQRRSSLEIIIYH